MIAHSTVELDMSAKAKAAPIGAAARGFAIALA